MQSIRVPALTVAGLLLAVPAVTPVQAQQPGRPTVDYHRADLIRTAAPFLLGGSLVPTWMRDSVRFHYTSSGKGEQGTVFLVDPARGTRRVLFDNARMAAALSLVADTMIDPAGMARFTLTEDEQSAEYRIRRKVFHCTLTGYACTEPDTVALNRAQFLRAGPDWATRSPDKQWDAFVWGPNVYLRPAELTNQEMIARQDSLARDRAQRLQDSLARARGDSVPARPRPPAAARRDTVPLPAGSIQLTTDGETLFGYHQIGRNTRQDTVQTRARRSSLRWAPDSKKLVALKNDVRKVRIYPLYSSTKDQPEDRSYYFSAPGDSVIPTYQIHVLDVAARSNVKVQDQPVAETVHGVTGLGTVVWGRTSEKLFALNALRGSRRIRANLIDPTTGELRSQIARDSNSTFVELAPGGSGANWSVVNGGEDILWWSTRDGWGHLYRFDEMGTLKNQVTSGAWTVMNLVKVDSVRKQIFFTANGKEPGNPHYSRFYRVNFDGSGMTLLTPEVGFHQITMVPKADFFIDTYAPKDSPPRIVLRSTVDGRVVVDLLQGNAELLAEIGWRPPELIRVKGRDGVTDIWGLLYKPSHFDSTRSYPILDFIYPGPQRGSVQGWGFSTNAETQGLAELGFIIIQLDHMGSPGRSKAFHDHYFGDMGDNGLPDHVAAIRQLASRHSWIDINRVGIYGHSGGGFASTGAMFRYPDFFKVAVSGAGNHDNRTYGYFWGEKYQGPYQKTGNSDNYANQANYLLAGNLKGKLLLIHGDLDSNVHPANTLRVVDALIKANKDFDMIIYPDAGHGFADYATRKRWDYFVTHLLGATPPAGYQMLGPMR